MASEYGEDFYAETNFPEKLCSPFVHATVLPLLGKLPHSFAGPDDLRMRIIKWLEIVRRDQEDVLICVDYETDWDLFCRALDDRVPAWIHLKMVDQDINQLLLYYFFETSGLPEPPCAVRRAGEPVRLPTTEGSRHLNAHQSTMKNRRRKWRLHQQRRLQRKRGIELFIAQAESMVAASGNPEGLMLRSGCRTGFVRHYRH